jgi:predicted acylesterase/phospholipase RssA
METALISGGGDYIAFTVGRFQALRKDYDVVIGTSAGALIAPLVALGKYDKIEEAITNITPNKIFNVNPFNKKGNIRYLHAIYRIATLHRTIGENENLPKLIKTFYTEEDHRALLAKGKEVYVTVCNTNKADYPSEIVKISECSYDEAVNYMWASASVPAVCSLVKIGDYEYSDGGVTQNVPLEFLEEKGIKKVDVFLHDVKPENIIKSNVKNIFQFAWRFFKWQRKKVQFDQILTIDKNIEAKFYWLPYKPNKPALTFDRFEMLNYVKDGYEQISQR